MPMRFYCGLLMIALRQVVPQPTSMRTDQPWRTLSRHSGKSSRGQHRPVTEHSHHGAIIRH